MPRFGKTPVLAVLCTLTIVLLLWSIPRFDAAAVVQKLPGVGLLDQEPIKRIPRLKPKPDYLPPPIADPFPLLQHSDPPPIPEWNIPDPKLHTAHNLPLAPHIFIGFGRTWPVLLQCVVSYITAGWPPGQLIVVENTGVQHSNKDGLLTLQNPFYLNYTILEDILGVKVVRTPTILNFAQMQNFFFNHALENEWDYYLFSHSDQLVFSREEGSEREESAEGEEGPEGEESSEGEEGSENEEGSEDVNPPAGEPGYKAMYQIVVESIEEARERDPGWGRILYAFNDYLTAFNTKAMNELGGWDSMIPFYTTDCDMYTRMRLGGWSDRLAVPGHFHDVSSVLNDLRVLYRDTTVIPQIIELNPLSPMDQEKVDKEMAKKDPDLPINIETDKGVDWNDPKQYYNGLRKVARTMVRVKLADNGRGRNTWQMAQRGGQGEPYYYDPEGIDLGISALNDAGKQNFRDKWASERCGADIVGVGANDGWRILPLSEWR